jgi:hypothetical protein
MLGLISMFFFFYGWVLPSGGRWPRMPVRSPGRDDNGENTMQDNVLEW